MKFLSWTLSTISLFISTSIGAVESSSQHDTAHTTYASNAIGVLAGVRRIDLIMKVCAQSFPEVASRNEQAYQDWRHRYSGFLQEVNKHVEIAVWRIENRNIGDYWAGLDQIGLLLDQQREDILKNMKADGDDRFKNRCNNYESFLLSSDTDLETKYRGALEVLRAEPLTKIDLQRPHD